MESAMGRFRRRFGSRHSAGRSRLDDGACPVQDLGGHTVHFGQIGIAQGHPAFFVAAHAGEFVQAAQFIAEIHLEAVREACHQDAQIVDQGDWQPLVAQYGFQAFFDGLLMQERDIFRSWLRGLMP